MGAGDEMKTFEKTPSEVLSHRIRWQKLLDGATLLSDSWVSDSTVTIDSSTSDTDSSTVVYSGGSIGDKSIITCTMTGSDGKVREQSIKVVVVEFRGE